MLVKGPLATLLEVLRYYNPFYPEQLLLYWKGTGPLKASHWFIGKDWQQQNVATEKKDNKTIESSKKLYNF